MTRTIGSLFTGYGGLDMAVHQVLGADTVWVSEIEPGACRVLEHRMPGVPNLGDITRIDWGTVPPVDVLTGGSPCQDLSSAGRRAGMTDGTRSNLWVAMREAIANLRPSLVVWENVRGAYSAVADSGVESCPGCVGDRGGKLALRALGRVLGDLAGLGYDAQWCGLRAADVGACHGRFRVFVLAYARGLGGHEALEHDGRRAAAGDRASVFYQRDREPLRPGPDGGLTLLLTPQAHDHTNGKTREQVEAARRRSKAGVRNLNEVVIHEIPLLPTPSVADTQGGRKSRSGERNGELLLNGIAHHDRWGDYAASIARHEQALGRPAPNPTEPGPKGNPRLSAAFVEWMMGLPDGWVTDVPGVTRSQQLRMLGNGVVPQQAAEAIRVLAGVASGYMDSGVA